MTWSKERVAQYNESRKEKDKYLHKTWYRNNKKNLLQRKYNITSEYYDELIVRQDNKCAICKKSFLSEDRYTAPCIDHDHKTGKVRGLLCHTCNLSLGHLESFLDQAIKYIKENEICT